MKEPVKITKKIVGYRVVTSEEVSIKSLVDSEIAKISVSLEMPLEELTKGNVTYLEQGEVMQIVKAELKRPRKLSSETYRLKPPNYEHAIYVHISDIIHEGKKHPFECFFSCKNPANIMWVSTITLLLSETFREAITGNNNLTKVLNNLKEVCDASGGYFATVGEKKKHVGSIMAEIGYILEAHVQECKAWNYSQSSHERPPTEEEKQAAFFNSAHGVPCKPKTQVIHGVRNNDGTRTDLICNVTNPCPDCGEQLSLMDGCWTCVQGCGWSKCS